LEITTRDMRILELNCVAIGIPLRLLMEAAGKSVADEVVRRAGSYTNSRVIILAGKGGNGGDGLVAARYLASRGFKVTVYLAYDPKLIDHPDTKFNYEILSRMGSVEIVVFEDHLVINESDIIIDALLGTGVKGEIRDPLKRMIEE